MGIGYIMISFVKNSIMLLNRLLKQTLYLVMVATMKPRPDAGASALMSMGIFSLKGTGLSEPMYDLSLQPVTYIEFNKKEQKS